MFRLADEKNGVVTPIEHIRTASAPSEPYKAQTAKVDPCIDAASRGIRTFMEQIFRSANGPSSLVTSPRKLARKRTRLGDAAALQERLEA